MRSQPEDGRRGKCIASEGDVHPPALAHRFGVGGSTSSTQNAPHLTNQGRGIMSNSGRATGYCMR